MRQSTVGVVEIMWHRNIVSCGHALYRY